MDKTGVGIVAEVEGRQVDKVEYQYHFGPDEVRVHKEQDEGSVEQVVDDEVAADGASSVDMLYLAREQMSDVAQLQDEQEDPVRDSLVFVSWRSTRKTARGWANGATHHTYQ